MKFFSTFSLLLSLFLFTGCNSTPKDFKLAFTMESRNVYKSTIEINNDSSFHIQQENLYFDAQVKKQQINSSEGKLSDKEFNDLTRLVSRCRFFELKNTYGFNKSDTTNNNPFIGLLYHLKYSEENKAKSMLLRPDPSDKIPENVSRLIKFLNDFSSDHLKKAPN